MQHSSADATSEHSDPQPVATGWRRTAQRLLLGLLLLSVAASIVPLKPDMPDRSLDGSWAWSMNQAVAQHLVFGRDIVFTFGPYASIYTRTYHPATDALMLGGSGVLAVGFVLAFFLLLRSAGLLQLLAWFVAIAVLSLTMDAILLVYPVLVALCCWRLSNCRRSALLAALLCFPLGLLPLVKTSTIPLCAGSLALIVGYLLWERKWMFAAIAAVTPPVSLVMWWRLAGQPLDALPAYFINVASIISGYTEAMAKSGPMYEIVLYLLAGAGAAALILIAGPRPRFARACAFVLLGLFFFIGLKGGFVRHDSHARLAAGTAILIVLLLPFVTVPSHAALRRVAYALGIVAWIVINLHYGLVVNDALPNIARGAWLRLRPSNGLDEQYKHTMEQIAADGGLPVVEGSSDLYFFRQSYLIASANTWNPRPIIQSYSAYTDRLTALNRAHLTSSDGPDHLFVQVGSIDGRLPTLDDGESWPVLLACFRPIERKGEYIVLQRRSDQNAAPELRTIASASAAMGQLINVPDVEGVVVARINVRQTPLGRLATLLFKPSCLQITVVTQDGSRTFRTVSGVMTSGFIVSPLVQSNTDLLALYANDTGSPLQRVSQLRIEPTTAWWVWEHDVEVSFEVSPLSQSESRE